LNNSGSAEIILQSVTSKLRNSVIDWELTDEEKEFQRFIWMQKSIKSIDKILERYYKENPK